MLTLLLLFFTGLAAGFVDSIAGGGGLITLPMLMSLGVPFQHCLGTNKLQAAFGTSMAVWRYAKGGLIQWHTVRWAILWTLLGAAFGAWCVARVDAALLNQAVPWMLLAVAVYTLCSPKLGAEQRQPALGVGTFALVFGLVIGFYDGFFGPGTGTFWTLACVTLLGLSLPQATAYTKLVNLTSNVASLAVFALAGTVSYKLAVAMIAGQLIGARLGSGMVLKHGAPFVRIVFLAVVFALVAHLMWKQFG
jgi:uncharacterized protein